MAEDLGVPLEALKQDFQGLKDLPADAEAADKRRRGTKFEDWLKKLLTLNKAAPQIRLRPSGEEIDGSFSVWHRTFLFEAKWTADSIPASALYAFKGKVDGKLVGTVGVFLSMAGFSDDAVDALLAGKNLNLVLFNRDDIEACLETPEAFCDILDFKLRAAAEEGTPFKPYKETRQAAATSIIVVCEGKFDQLVLQAIVSSGVFDDTVERLTILAGNGKLNSAKLATGLIDQLREKARLIAIVEADGDAEGTRRLFPEPDSAFHLIVLDHGVEQWLVGLGTQSGETPGMIKQFLWAMPPNERRNWLRDWLNKDSVKALIIRHPNLAEFIQLLQ